MHSKRASAQKKVRGRKGVAPEMKPAEREDKGQGRGKCGGDQSGRQQNKYNRRTSRDVPAKVSSRQITESLLCVTTNSSLC